MRKKLLARTLSGSYMDLLEGDRPQDALTQIREQSRGVGALNDVIGSFNLRSSAHTFEPLPLRANFSWTLAGNIVYAGCQWGMLVVLAKLGTPQMVGQFALGLAICAPVILFANLQLRAVQATDAKREYPFADYLGLRLITTPLALLLIAGIVLGVGYRGETALVILAVGIAKAFESVSDIFYGLLQQNERMDRIAKSSMIKGPMSLAALGVGLYLTGSILWATVSLAAAWALVLLGYDVPSGKLVLQCVGRMRDRAETGRIPLAGGMKPRWEIATLRKLALLALPLGFVMMLISLNSNIPRYFVERYLGEEALGIFAAMAYVMVAGMTVVTALGQSATPRLAKYHAEGNNEAFRTLLLKLVGIGALLGMVGMLVALVAGRHILTLIYRQEYSQHPEVLVWLMVAAGFWYLASTLGYAATASRRIHYQPLALCAVVVVSLSACYTLVPAHGLWGAAISVVAASATGVLGYSFLLITRGHKL